MNSEIYSKNLLKILDFVKPKNKDVNMHENIVNILIMVIITLYNWIDFMSIKAKNVKLYLYFLIFQNIPFLLCQKFILDERCKQGSPSFLFLMYF